MSNKRICIRFSKIGKEEIYSEIIDSTSTLTAWIDLKKLHAGIDELVLISTKELIETN